MACLADIFSLFLPPLSLFHTFSSFLLSLSSKWVLVQLAMHKEIRKLRGIHWSLVKNSCDFLNNESPTGFAMSRVNVGIEGSVYQPIVSLINRSHLSWARLCLEGKCKLWGYFSKMFQSLCSTWILTYSPISVLGHVIF